MKKIFQDPSRIRMALPNKGRLREPAISLLTRAGYVFRAKDRSLYATCANDLITFIFVRTEDIPVLVGSGVIDLGITGEDLVEEREAVVTTVLPLGFGRCRLCVAVDEGSPYHAPADLSGKVIATSFPQVAAKFFRKHGAEVRMVEMNGSVEVMTGLGLAEGIVDLVETGDSLKDNGLRVLSEIGSYQTALIAHPQKAADPRVARVRRRVEGILIAEKYSLLEYNIPRDQLSDAEKITPGYSSPTISDLEDRAWVAVKVMVEKNRVAAVCDSLEAIGARAILETAIQNCRL